MQYEFQNVNNEFKPYKWYQIITYNFKQILIFSRPLEIGVQSPNSKQLSSSSKFHDLEVVIHQAMTHLILVDKVDKLGGSNLAKLGRGI